MTSHKLRFNQKKNDKRQTTTVSDEAPKKNQITCWYSRGRVWVKM